MKQFSIFGGLDECFEYLKNFKFTEEHINYLKTQFPHAEEEFFTYLTQLDMSDIKIYGFSNGDFVLPNEPILTLEGTMDKLQLIETTLLNLTNYPTSIVDSAPLFPSKVPCNAIKQNPTQPYLEIIFRKNT